MNITWKIALAICLTRASLWPQSPQVEPKGGSWKTWVLSSGAQYRLAPPPDSSATASELAWVKAFNATMGDYGREQVAYWDEGSPSYHWIQWLENKIASQTLATTSAARQMALLNVAIYDAQVAAWDSKYAYNRQLPAQLDPTFHPSVTGPNVPSYPNEFAVAGAAAAAVLGYLYPADAASLNGMAELAGKSRLYAGVAFPSDYFAGLQLGAQVAQDVISRAKLDGSSAVWTGTVPVGPGLWNGTNPSCPLCGTWKTWVLDSGSQFRPDPPLAYNSPEKQAELAFLHSEPRPFNDQANAFYWQTTTGTVAGWYDQVHTALFEDHLTGDALISARAYALMSVAHYDAMVACWDAKFTFWAIRPFQLDPTLTTLFATPNHPSYPAAHATLSTSITDVMSYLFPSRAAAFSALATSAGVSRMVAGIHYPSDINAGNALGHKVAQVVISWAEMDGSGR